MVELLTLGSRLLHDIYFGRVWSEKGFRFWQFLIKTGYVFHSGLELGILFKSSYRHQQLANWMLFSIVYANGSHFWLAAAHQKLWGITAQDSIYDKTILTPSPLHSWSTSFSLVEAHWPFWRGLGIPWLVPWTACKLRAKRSNSG